MNNKEAINEQQIENWKKEFGRVYKTTVGDEVVIWRKLRRKEYVQIMSEKSDDNKVYNHQELIVKTAALYPENIEELIEESAGIATCVSDEIILKSGFDFPTTTEL